MIKDVSICLSQYMFFLLPNSWRPSRWGVTVSNQVRETNNWCPRIPEDLASETEENNPLEWTRQRAHLPTSYVEVLLSAPQKLG